MAAEYVVLGGGIAGVQCTEELARLCPSAKITLVSQTSTLKGVGDVKKMTAVAETFKIVEKSLDELPYPNVVAVKAEATRLDAKGKILTLSNGSKLRFDKLCICTGAAPNKVVNHARCMVLRDQDSIEQLKHNLKHSRRVLILGNGGIALELIHALSGFEVVWAVKHKAMGDAFFDYDAAAFLKAELERRSSESGSAVEQTSTSCSNGSTSAAARPAEQRIAETALGYGHAVGPQWVDTLPSRGPSAVVTMEAECELDRIEENPADNHVGPIRAHLSNGRSHDVDIIISATGVRPNTAWLQDQLKLDPQESGILINRKLESSVPGIYAAGDACTLAEDQQEAHFFQMRLWTQAKFMGAYAAQCMAERQDEAGLSFCFEIFTHVTRFLGKKVVLLGLYNGQKVDKADHGSLVSYCRSTEGPDSSFARVLMLRGRMIGAVLIGETEMEEAFQNLILDGLDLSSIGPSILDPELEIDHIFD